MVDGIMPCVLEQTWYIERSVPYSYNFWWPWLKNSYGQGLGQGEWLQYYWIDQDLKRAMGK